MMLRIDPGTIKGGSWLLISQCWIICKVDVSSGTGCLLLLGVFMHSPPESSASSPDRNLEEELRVIKRKVKKLDHLFHCMDSEGGRRLENVDQDLIHLRKQLKLGISKTEQVFIWFLAELEVKIERLELKVARLEMHGSPGPSSCPRENDYGCL